MANVSIPNLPAAIALSGGEQMEAVQAGTSVRLTTAQIAGLSNSTLAIPIPTAAALRALTTSTSYPVVFLQSYSGTVGDGASGEFVYNSGDISSGWYGVASISGNSLSIASTINGTMAIGLALWVPGQSLPVWIESGSGTSWTFSGSGLGTVASTTMSADNGLNIAVDQAGRRWYGSAGISVPVSPRWFGAIGNGTLVTLSSLFANSAAAQAGFPLVAATIAAAGSGWSSISVDWCGIQSAINFLSPFTWGGSVIATSQGAGNTSYPTATYNISKGGRVYLGDEVTYVVNQTILHNPNVTLEGGNAKNLVQSNDVLPTSSTPGFTQGCTIVGQQFSNPAAFIIDTAPYNSSGVRDTTFNELIADKDSNGHTWMPRCNIIGVNVINNPPLDGANAVYGAIRQANASYSRLDRVHAIGQFIGIARTGCFEDDWGTVWASGFHCLHEYSCLKHTIEYFTPTLNQFGNLAIATSGQLSAMSNWITSGDFSTQPSYVQSICKGFVGDFTDVDFKGHGQAAAVGLGMLLWSSHVTVTGYYEEETGINSAGSPYASLPSSEMAIVSLNNGSVLKMTAPMSKSTYVGQFAWGDDTSVLKIDVPRIIAAPKLYSAVPISGVNGNTKITLTGMPISQSLWGWENYSSFDIPSTCYCDFEPAIFSNASNSLWIEGWPDMIFWCSSTAPGGSSGLNTAFPATIGDVWNFLSRNGSGKNVLIYLQGNATTFSVAASLPTVVDCNIVLSKDYTGGNPTLQNASSGTTATNLPMQGCNLTLQGVNVTMAGPGSGSLDCPFFLLTGQNTFTLEGTNFSVAAHSSFVGAASNGAQVTISGQNIVIAYSGGATAAHWGIGTTPTGANSILLYTDALQPFSSFPSNLTFDANVVKIASSV